MLLMQILKNKRVIRIQFKSQQQNFIQNVLIDYNALNKIYQTYQIQQRSQQQSQNNDLQVKNSIQSIYELIFQCDQKKPQAQSTNSVQIEASPQSQEQSNRQGILKCTNINTNSEIEGAHSIQESKNMIENQTDSQNTADDGLFVNHKQKKNCEENILDEGYLNSKTQKQKDQQNKEELNKASTKKTVAFLIENDEKQDTEGMDPVEIRRIKMQKNRMQINVSSCRINEPQQISNLQNENQNSTSNIQKENIFNENDISKDQELLQLEKEIRENIAKSKYTQQSNGNLNLNVGGETVQNDEFSLKFQSNCPIMSPTILKTKKKNELKKKATLSMENLDENYKIPSIVIKKEETIKIEIKNENIKSLTDKSGLLAEEIQETQLNIPSFVDPQIKSLAQVECVDQQSRDGIQLGFIADIKSIRNHKANAFRSRLNLSSTQCDGENDDFRKKSASISTDFVMPSLKGPSSIRDLHKTSSQGYNTAETPVDMKKSIITKRGTQNSLKSNQRIEEANDEYDILASQQFDQNEDPPELNLEKKQSRRFRTDLRVKVNHVKAEEKEEIWDVDDLTSTDQTHQEVPIVTKAKQGCSKFEDNYYLLNGRSLGEGTSGIVYQCKKINKEDDTVYAVKVMRNVDEEMSKSIFQTFGIQYRLQHEFISRVYEVYFNEDSQVVHFIMEYIPFRPLDSILKDKKRTLKETDASSIIQMLLKAVCYMEQRGVCHRDLKPENILISDDLQQIKLIDFGISKSFVKSQRVQHITQYYKHKMYTPTGTPQYKAPEILLGAGYTQLVDMWCVGIIAYQLVCKNKHPFKCDSQFEQDMRISKYQFDQTDQGWINASINAKNFIKQLLRQNRLPAFEALRHPWIEQRKIEVPADDDNRSACKQEKKSQGDSMTISVPTQFQPRAFNFGITVTNSEIQQRSSFSKRAMDGEVFDESQMALRACNTIYSEFGNHGPSGNNNALISSYSQKGRNSRYGAGIERYNNENQSGKSGNSGGDFEKSNNSNQTKPSITNKKKHTIQGFAPTQDVVHVVMRQKLSESREKMMQFFLKANTIIKNLEEEQLNKMNPTHKRTHSAEKQSDSPASPKDSFSKNLINNSGNGASGIGLNMFRNNSNGTPKQEILSFKDENPFKFDNINSQNMLPESNSLIQFLGIQNQSSQIHNSQSSSDESNRMMAKINNNQLGLHQNVLNKGPQSSFNSIGRNTSTIEPNNSSFQNITMGNNNAMIYSTADMNNMKFSSLLTRKTSMNNKPSDRKFVRRNSTQQTNCMEKSIIFTKEVIEELYQDPVIKETFYADNTANQMPPLYLGQAASLFDGFPDQFNDNNSLKPYSISNLGFLGKKQVSYFDPSFNPNFSNPSTMSNIRLSLCHLNSKRQSKMTDTSQQTIQEINSNHASEDKKTEDKWKLIAENMDSRSDSGSDSDDDEDDDNVSERSSDLSDNSGDDNNFSIDVTNLLILNPQQLNNTEEKDDQIEEKDLTEKRQKEKKGKDRKGKSDKTTEQQDQNEVHSSHSHKQKSQNDTINNKYDKLQKQNIGNTRNSRAGPSSFQLAKVSEQLKEYQQEKGNYQNNSSSSGGSNKCIPKNNVTAQQGGIFQSTPYTNYMNSSKDNKINQTLLSIQTQQQDQNLQINAVLTTSSTSSKENPSSNHLISHKNDNVSSKNNKIQNIPIFDDKYVENSITPKSLKNQYYEQNLTQYNSKQCENNCSNSELCFYCQSIIKQDTIVEDYSDCIISDPNYNLKGKSPSIGTLLQNYHPHITMNQSKPCESILNSLFDDKSYRDKISDVSIQDSAGNNLSFIDMNQSKWVQSMNNQLNQSEDAINSSLKKHPFVSLNLSQASSLNANNNSLNASGNTMRSLQGLGLNLNQPNINQSNNEINSSFNLNVKEKNNSVRFAESPHSCKNSAQKKSCEVGQNFVYGPQKINQNVGDNQNIQIQQNQNIDNQLSSNSGDNQISKDSSNDQTNLNQNSDQTHLIEQGMNVSIQISPQKKYFDEQGILEFKDNMNFFENSSDQQNDDAFFNRNQDIQQLISQKSLQLKLKQSKYLQTNYSTILEESSDIRSCLTSSIMQSQRLNSEFDNPSISTGFNFNKLNNTRSETQINFVTDKNENNINSSSSQNQGQYASSILIQQMSQPLHTNLFRDQSHKLSLVVAQSTVFSAEDFDSSEDLEQNQNNEQKISSDDANNSKKIQISPIKKVCSSLKRNNQSQQQSSPQSTNSKSPNIVDSQSDEVFESMQKSSQLTKQDDNMDGLNNTTKDQNKLQYLAKQFSPLIEQDEHCYPEEGNIKTSIQMSSQLSEQPPILKNRKSSSTKLLEKENEKGSQKQLKVIDYINDDIGGIKQQLINKELIQIEDIAERNNDDNTKIENEQYTSPLSS